jgi:hypothetical protein
MVCGYICIGALVLAFVLLWAAMDKEQSDAFRRARGEDDW